MYMRKFLVKQESVLSPSANSEGDRSNDNEEEQEDESISDQTEENDSGPWILFVTRKGYGKVRVSYGYICFTVSHLLIE